MKDSLANLYRRPLALLTDLYQFTMAQGYWKLGRHEEQTAFHLFFRQHPFGGGYTLTAGLERAAEFIESFHLTDDDAAYLASLTGNDGGPLFEPAFLDYLRGLELALDVDAMPEGTVAFPRQPLVRVVGPVVACQIIETPLLNLINFPTLVATKAARICQAAAGRPVLEFGLRRAQGIDGAITASRSAYVGGCAGTSNVLAGRLFDIPVKGTHAHSWVMFFDGELEAMLAYARAMPNNSVFLVDTYDTLAGVRHAIEAGRRLRQAGHEMIGIRLDSGDLTYLSIEARRLLDEAGFAETAIVASNDLDEHLIADLRQQGAAIGVWGVGTRLVTAHDDPALGGVYKLTAVRRGGEWNYCIKLSDHAAKATIPGVLQVRRFSGAEGFLADMIYDEPTGPSDARVIVDPLDPTRRRAIGAADRHEDLLVPIFRAGRRVRPPEPLANIRARAQAQLAGLHHSIRRFTNPHEYPAGLDVGLHDLRTQMILEAREEAETHE